MPSKISRVTVGMPVYNGQEFLSSALDSVLAQSFTDFELLVSDNASTDRTAEICQDYARRDPRLRYFRNDQNIGLVANHNRLVELAHGEYFMWFAHDDSLDKEYLARCVAALDGNPDAVLCFAKAGDIDENGRLLGEDIDHRSKAVPAESLALDSADPCVRFRAIIQLNYQCEPVYGVIRTSALQQTRLHGKYADSDRVFLAELAVRGRLLMVRDRLFFHREHGGRSVAVYSSRQARTVLMDPQQAGQIVLPHWREFYEFLQCIRLSPLSRQRRRVCYWEMLKWARQYRERLLSDIVVVFQDMLRKALPVPVRRAIKRFMRGASETK